MSGQAAIVLLSGGLDSATVLAIARRENRRCHALSFRYGQRHAIELQYAARQAHKQEVVAHEIVDLADLGRMVAHTTSLVISSPHEVPDASKTGEGVPSTYVPARNTIFLAYALAWAEVIAAGEIWIGVNAVDYSGYPDCRPEFIAAFERVANLGTRRGAERAPEAAIIIRAPLLNASKEEIVRMGSDLGVDFGDTVSCYTPTVVAGRVLACGRCDSCRLRRRGFRQAGIADPTAYVGST